jgi:dihydroorotate dehydrogenase electron transfer subunit
VRYVGSRDSVDLFRVTHRPKVLPINRIVVETPTVRSFYVNCPEIASVVRPGQFVMVWVIGVDEIPISVSEAGGDGLLGLTIAKVGDATSRLHEQSEGDLIGIKGPYGNGFDLSGNSVMMVGGGYGVAPLAFGAEVASSENKKVTMVMGAETAGELLFLERLRKMNVDLMVSTEDGSAGTKGLVTDVLERALMERGYDSCLCCGPEKMMVEVVRIASGKGIKVQASLERMMKCGIGLCGQCCLDPLGFRVCTEGPVFYPHQLEGGEFGKYARDAAGIKKEI